MMGPSGERNGTNMEQRTENDLNRAFVKLLEGQVNRGVYVWGGNGELLDSMQDPKAWIERHETSAADAKRAIKLFEARKAQGKTDIRAFDCSGLVYWALKTLGLLKSDVNSRGLYALCTPKKPGEEVFGDLVFHHNGIRIVHVGVCVGDAQIESKGRDDGVVKNVRKKGYWNRVGRFNGFPKDEGGTKTVFVKGGSVRIRTGDSVLTPCVGIAHRGDTFPYLGVAPSGWYQITYRGEPCCISSRKDLTEVRNG